MTSDQKIPALNNSQQQSVFQLAGKFVAATATRHTCESAIELLGEETAKIMVLGAFVSLKRDGALRACMGCLAHELMPLGAAVENAAMRAASDDPRFPPISPIELSSLEMEVWVLWGMRQLKETGTDRLNVIEIGRHGLHIVKGNRRGLLLPGVAIDHHLDVKQFLEAVCRKAELPLDAWRDDHVILSVFEGISISGVLSSVLLQERIQPSFFSVLNGPKHNDVVGLCEATRQNFFRFLDGMVPSYYQPEFYDGNMCGVALTITLPEAVPMVCARNGIKGDVPLQSSLVEFSRALSEQIRRIGPDAIDLLQTRFDLFLQWDVAIHGNLQSYDLSTIDTKRRSLMLNVHDSWAMLFDQSATPEQLLEQLCETLDVDTDKFNCIYSFATASTSSHFELTSAEKPPIFPKLRPAMLPGSFYPKLSKEIESELNRMLAPGEIVPKVDGIEPIPSATFQKNALPKPIEVAAVIVPHAGWVYSGRLAAQTLARVVLPETAVIFSTKHRPSPHTWGVAPYKTWGIPFGNVPSDLTWASQFVSAVPRFRFDEEAHQHEHGIEVQIPILSRLKPDIKIVGVTMGGGDWDEIEESANNFAHFLKQSETKPLLIISSDMNHYAAEEVTRNVDKLALDALLTLNPEHFYDTIIRNQISMCGVVAASFVLKTLEALNLFNQVLPVGYTTSSNYSGDRQRVVGYAGLLIK